MAYSQNRASYSSWAYTAEDNGPTHWDSRPVLNVQPLSCVPPQQYSDATTSVEETNSSPAEGNPTPLYVGKPAMVFLPSHATNDEWKNIIAATKSGIALTGTAAMGKVGPTIGSVDIAESQEEYVFRVSLPGVARDETFKYECQPDGKVTINGVTSTGEKTVKKHNMVFQMQSQNLCPPGEFSVSFQLPGPIDNQVTTVFGSDGTFEGVVKKRMPTYR